MRLKEILGQAAENGLRVRSQSRTLVATYHRGYASLESLLAALPGDHFEQPASWSGLSLWALLVHGSCPIAGRSCKPPVFRLLEAMSGQSASAVRALQIHLWADGDDAGRIDVVMGHIVVPLNVIEIHGLRDTRHLVEVPKVAV